MNTHDTESDKAGQGYWNDTWEVHPLPAIWDVKSKNIRSNVESGLFMEMEAAFREAGMLNAEKKLIEVGCARSAVLPLFASEMGFRVSGLDYSPNGCEQTRQILQREGVEGDIYQCDLFTIPEMLVEQFDVVVSFGLIEHFSDTDSVVAALARLVKPGGLIFTNIPNMNGATGLTQRLLNKKVYDIHIPLTADDVKVAHERSGLQVLSSDYFLSTNFGVVNIDSQQQKNVIWWVKKVILAILARTSMLAWQFERNIHRLPTSRLFSPYVNCVARKPPIA